MTHVLDAVSAPGPEAVIAAAVALQTLGFLFRQQITLRLLVMSGSVCYVVYYFTAADEPLWAAIFGSALLIAANMYGLVGLLLSRAAFAVRRDQRHILGAMTPLEPGLFRRLMRAAEARRVEAETPLTEEGRAPEALHFVVSGRLALSRGGGPRVEISGPCFIGEVAWMLGVPASAAVTALPGAEVVSWPVPALRRLAARSPRLETALHALIARDMARKVAASTPIRPAAAAAR